jgi:membrane-associated phospholipid phosphatase
MVLLLVCGAGIGAGGLVALVAHRWPQIEAPRLGAPTVATEIELHPTLRDHLLRHFNPKTESGIALSAAAGIVLVAATGLGVLAAMIREHFGLSKWDGRFAQYGADHATQFSTDTMKSISLIGGTTGAIAIAVVACAVEFARRPTRALPAFLACVVAGQFAVSNGIKYLVGRTRPDFDRLTGFAGSSFPSGHATASAATLAAVALLVTRGRSRRTKIVAAAIAAGVAAMVASTRVLLGVHWFTDVLAGLLIGWGWFALVSIAFGGRLLIFGEPVAMAEELADTARPVETSR